MNIKLFLKLGLLLLSLLCVSCGQDSDLGGKDSSSKASTSQSVSSNETLEEESLTTTSPSVESTEDSELEDEGLKEDIQENTETNIIKGLTEEEYYMIIKEAKQRQQDYIDSIDDAKIKQSVQTSYSAAIAESSSLYIKYPNDTDTINSALKRVLNGE